MNLGQTICALATAPLVSALAIIRISGRDSFNITNKIFSKVISVEDSAKIFYGKIKDGDEIIDEVILLAYKGPKSFTGEDVVEIISHGSPLIVGEILDVLVKHGARLAEKGEFSMRGHLNNKFDLIQAEAINDMIHSSTKEAKNLSLLSLEGKTTNLILPYKDMIAALLADIEVNIDFPEYEDIEEKSHKDIARDLSAILEGIQDLVAQGNEGKIIKNGIKVALVGKPNVGKSSLLNAILREDKAIVTEVAGTTRDVVEGEINVNGITFHFFDTAGLHDTKDKIETIGIEKTKRVILDADYVIYVKDATCLDKDNCTLDDVPNDKLITVYNKSDIKKTNTALQVSAVNRDLNGIFDELFKRLNISKDSFTRPSFNNDRQLSKLKTIYELLSEARDLNKQALTLDLISVPLQSAYREITELLGLEYTQDLSEEIFSRFCVGK